MVAGIANAGSEQDGSSEKHLFYLLVLELGTHILAVCSRRGCLCRKCASFHIGALTHELASVEAVYQRGSSVRKEVLRNAVLLRYTDTTYVVTQDAWCRTISVLCTN